MKPIHAIRAAAISLAVASCVPQTRTPPPTQPVPPPPAPALTPAPAPVHDSWMDAPQTPGDWGYRDGLASYRSPAGEPRFTMRCDRQTGTVVLARPGPPAGQMTVRTESQTRTLPAPSTQGSSEARVSAGDRLLDAMAFSKGRFAIETPGAPALYLPSWAEVTRVIQDCR